MTDSRRKGATLEQEREMERLFVADVVAEVRDYKAEVERLRAAIRRMECTCLPHAKPYDGMCERCMALTKPEGES